MNTNFENLQELAALQALGALDEAEAQAFSHLLTLSAEARDELGSAQRVAEGLAEALPRTPAPSPELKQRILRKVEKTNAKTELMTRLKSLVPAGAGGFAFLPEAAESGWMPLPIPGAFVKLLSFDSDNDYATVLGKLTPGARYPSHHHKHSECLFMISGDLHIGEQVIRAGDFHHADAGSSHGVNWSENGCVLLAVLSKEDLIEQFAYAGR